MKGSKEAVILYAAKKAAESIWRSCSEPGDAPARALAIDADVRAEFSIRSPEDTRMYKEALFVFMLSLARADSA